METFNDIINGNTPVLVDFFAEWCSPCKAMKPVLDNLKQSMGDKVRIIKIDVDKNQTLAASHSVQAVPTFILFLKGKAVWRTSGACSMNTLKETIERYI